MFITLKLLSLVAGFGLLTGMATLTVRAADATATGTVSGTVVDADAKPVAGATVNLMDKSTMPHHDKQDAVNGSSSAKPLADKPKHEMPKPVATAQTDNDGKFSMKDVPAGEYVAVVRARKLGNAHADVTVTAGQDTTVDLTLKARKAK
jgi:hypothetical protein